MSERYPAISQLLSENRIPEFDCLYVRNVPMGLHCRSLAGLLTGLLGSA